LGLKQYTRLCCLQSRVSVLMDSAGGTALAIQGKHLMIPNPSDDPNKNLEDMGTGNGTHGATQTLRDRMITMLCDQDDESFSEELLHLTRTDYFGPHGALLWESRILARLYALPDTWLTSTVLTLADTEHLGLDVLFDDRLLPRLAAIRNGHLRGTFLPYARHLRGFDARDFLRELRRTQQHQRAQFAATGTPVVVSMDTVTVTPVTWLWWPYIALGKLTMLDGDPGIGKSLLMTQLAASLSRGNPLPDQEGKPTLETGGAHTTVMLSTEDGLADTLKPRLDAAGADSSKIKVLTGWVDTDGTEHVFTFQHMPILERTLQEYQPRLVVIDPLQAYLGNGVDMHRANETRPLLEELRKLAEEYQCAIVCIRHPAKSSQGGKAIHRGLGSVDFIGAARTGLFVEQHPSDPGMVLLAQSKSNLGPLGRTQLFTKHEGQFEWCGVSRLNAELLAGSGRGPDPYAFLEAVCWLEDRLQDGVPVSSEQLRQEADEEGISFPTLRRAKKALGVRSRKRAEQWDWHLPGMATIPLPRPLVSLASLAPLEPLQEHQGVRENPGTGGIASPSPEARQDCSEDVPPDDTKEESSQPLENMEGVQEEQDAQAGEERQAGISSPTNGHHGTAPEMSIPCVVCGSTVWWNDGGTLRCSRCWPPSPLA